MHKIYLWAVFIAVNAYCSTSLAQATTDSGALAKAVSFYTQSIGSQSEIYNGTQYMFYPPAYKGTAYFKDNSLLLPSAVKYSNTWYENVPLVYDLYKELLVSMAPNKFSKYSLHNDKVSEFYVLGHHFIYLNDSSHTNIKPGFYDLLYGGKIEVWVKRSKSRTEDVTPQGVQVTFNETNTIYIKTGNQYHTVSSKGSVLTLFKNKKKELKQYLKDNNIEYSDNKELSVVKLASYYDKITD